MGQLQGTMVNSVTLSVTFTILSLHASTILADIYFGNQGDYGDLDYNGITDYNGGQLDDSHRHKNQPRVTSREECCLPTVTPPTPVPRVTQQRMAASRWRSSITRPSSAGTIRQPRAVCATQSTCSAVLRTIPSLRSTVSLRMAVCPCLVSLNWTASTILSSLGPSYR